MSWPRTVLLFDIDGTLILTGGAGRRAMLGAFERLHGRDDVFEGFSFAGMTDRAIARHGLSRSIERVDDVAIDRLLDAYLELLESELAVCASYTVLPGVSALIESLHAETKREHVAIGLGTGNVKRGAYAKLGRGELHGAFAFGGFGCDAEDRAELLRAGAKRGAEALRVPLDECRVVVIGDTPKDVAAAAEIGAMCIGVATGSYTCAELEACGATRVFETLADATVRDALLFG